MRKSFIVTLFILLSVATAAQTQDKPTLDMAIITHWPTVENGTITNNGRFVQYCIRIQPINTATLVLQSTGGKWKMELPGVESARFTSDGRNAVFMRQGDSLGVVKLSHEGVEYIAHVRSYRVYDQGAAQYLAYLTNTPDKKLVLYDLVTQKQRSYPGVIDYVLSADGKNLITKSESNGHTTEIAWINVADDQTKIIWQGNTTGRLILDDNGVQLAFKTDGNISGQLSGQLMYYKEGTATASVLPIALLLEQHQDLEIDDALNFSKDGSKLFFNFREKDLAAPRLNIPKLDVWSYYDAKLQSQQLFEQMYKVKNYLAVIHMDNKERVMLLQKKGEQLKMDAFTDDFAIFNSQQGDLGEWNWAITGKQSYTVSTTETGQHRSFNLDFPWPSADHKFMICWEQELRDMYSYELATGVSRNISRLILNTVVDGLDGTPMWKNSKGLFYAGCLQNGKILLNDTYDIWEVDPFAREAPVCLTNGYGRKNGIVFRLAMKYEDVIPTEKKMILSATKLSTKDNGFYQMRPGKREDPLKLIMEPYVFDHLIKARDSSIYLLQRQGVAESSNYFWTKDFRVIHPISSVYPERQYNWMKSKLYTYTVPGAGQLQGVLYSPENLDPRKKYPLIMHYYEQKSGDLNRFHIPQDENGNIDIPWFVSHGYLVFTPDIRCKIGGPGKSACQSIVAAAKFISKLSYVDKDKIGLQGHSFGGYETNFVITHSNLFKAAVSSSGISDLVGQYFDPWGGGNGRTDYYENRQGRMASSPWERRERYIENSPIFYVAHVTTPVLLISNKADNSVDFKQGQELFLALRQLGKKAWMLQYDGEGHGLGGAALTDYTIRMTQFFDFYLKGKYPPTWMSQGIPASRKGYDSGLELDTSGRQLPEGLSIKHAGKLKTK
jgi:dienelactone hydrolase